MVQISENHQAGKHTPAGSTGNLRQQSVDGRIRFPRLEHEEADTIHTSNITPYAHGKSEHEAEKAITRIIAKAQDATRYEEVDTEQHHRKMVDQEAPTEAYEDSNEVNYRIGYQEREDEVYTLREQVQRDVTDKQLLANKAKKRKNEIASEISQRQQEVADERRDTIRFTTIQLVHYIKRRNSLIREWVRENNQVHRNREMLDDLHTEIQSLKQKIESTYEMVYSYLDHPERINDGLERNQDYIAQMREYVQSLKNYYEPLPGELAETVVNLVRESDLNTPSYPPHSATPESRKQYAEIDNTANYYRARIHDYSRERAEVVQQIKTADKKPSLFRRAARFFRLDSDYKKLLQEKEAIEAKITETRNLLSGVTERQQQYYRVEVPE